MIKRALMLAACVLVPVVSFATPASAGELGGGAGTNESCSGAHCVAVAMSMNVEPTDLGEDVVEFHCQVIAAPDPASTGVDACSVDGVSALLVPSNLPGAYDAAAGVAFVPSGADVPVCDVGHADFVESTAGGPTVSAGGCSHQIVLTVGN